MNIIPALLTPGADRGRSGKSFLNGKPEGVIIHYVGNPGSSAMANRNYFENGSGGNKVSAHYIVGLQGEIIQCVPENERAAHAGKSYAALYDETAKTNNACFLGIETCHPGADGKFTPVTYRSLVWLTADICVRHGFDLYTQVMRHYDVTGKQCPLYYVKNQGEWSKLRNAVYAGMLVIQCEIRGITVDTPYWERVMSGEIIANPEYVAILENRLSQVESGITVSVTGTPIMGESVLTVAQLAEYLLSRNSSPKLNCTTLELVHYYIKEGKAENVRGDIAFFQAAKETGWWNYGGIVKKEQNNFCGLGAENNNGAGQCASFETPEYGVRAHIQHLKAYASIEPLNVNCIDPRFSKVTRGCAPCWEGLNGKWAIPGDGYGENIVSMFNAALERYSDEADTEPEITVKDMLLTLMDSSAINTPESWIDGLESIPYFDWFVRALYEKYEARL